MEIRPGLPSGTYGQVSARPPRKEEGSRPCISRLVATDLEFAFELCFGSSRGRMQARIPFSLHSMKSSDPEPEIPPNSQSVSSENS